MIDSIDSEDIPISRHIAPFCAIDCANIAPAPCDLDSISPFYREPIPPSFLEEALDLTHLGIGIAPDRSERDSWTLERRAAARPLFDDWSVDE